MRTPANSASPTAVARIGQIHLDRMAPVPELAPQVQRFTPIQAQFVAAADAWRTAQSAARSAQTQRDEMCQVLVNLLHTIKTAVQNRVNRRRRSDLTDTYFPPTGVLPAAVRGKALVAMAEDLLAKLKEDSDATMTAYVDPLATALTNLKDAISALDTARAAARTARGLLSVQRNDWELGYKHDFYDLSLLYSAIPGRAESFFWHPGSVVTPANPPASGSGNGGEVGKVAGAGGAAPAIAESAIGGNGGGMHATTKPGSELVTVAS